MEYSVLPILPIPNDWPIKIGTILIAMEASIREDNGFEVSCFGKSHGNYQGSPIIDHPTSRGWKICPF